MLQKRTTTNGKILATLDSLIEWDKNPRNIKEEDFFRLKKQVARLGQYKPLFVNAEGVVVGGNMRLRTLRWLNENVLKWADEDGTEHQIDRVGQFAEVWVTELGVGEEPIEGVVKYHAILDGKVEAELFDSIEQMMIEYGISDNDPAGSYDQKALFKLLQPYEKLKSMPDYKFSLQEPVKLKSFIAEFNKDAKNNPEAQTPNVTEDEAPGVDDANTFSKPGEIYQLGRHKLLCGDSTNVGDISRLLGEEKADMVFTDPPYLMGFEGNVHADGSKSFNAEHGAIKNDKMSREDGDIFLSKIMAVIKEFDKGAFYICFYRLGLHNLFKAMEVQNMQYRSVIIWAKGNHTLSNSDYMSKYEPVVYGWTSEHKFKRKPEFDIWEIERTPKNELHPTMKPVALCARAIINSSDANGLVLDIFGGSGSTLIACEQTDRRCAMVELDAKYCDVIRKRYAKFTSQLENWQEATPLVNVSIPVPPVTSEQIIPSEIPTEGVTTDAGADVPTL